MIGPMLQAHHCKPDVYPVVYGRQKMALWLLLLVASLFAAPAYGQILFGGGTADSDIPRSSADAVSVEVKQGADGVHPGDEIRIAVVLDIMDGWHINAHRPTLDYLIGTNLEVETHSEVMISDVRYPRARQYAFDFAGEVLDVYEGEAPIFLAFRTADDIEPQDVVLRGELTVQACDDQVCLAPSTRSLEISFPVVDESATVQTSDDSIFALYDRGDPYSAGGDTTGITGILETEAMWLAFITIFLIGLALNLTPCVYPMLSVTVSLFGGQEDQNTFRVFRKALVYVLGIAGMYSVLGVAAALSGGLFGAWLQSPYVLAGIGVLLFALALGMFGLFELQMPYWMTSRLGTAGNAGGYVGLFFSGLVVGIFAAPCIGPPIIALLTFVGTRGDPVTGFLIFFVLSLGLGFPYLILGTFSGLLRKLPQSGVWMVWVKKVFGVVLAGAALFYLGLAFAPGLVEYVIPVTLLFGGIYLGFAEKSGSQIRSFQGFKYLLGTACVVGALVAFNHLQRDGIEWESFEREKLELAAAEAQPVVLDFYADWCIPCIELERRTFTDPEVIRSTADFVRLKVDLTQFNSPQAEELRREFEVAGVPTIVFLDSSGREIRQARIVGFVPPREFLRSVEAVNRDLQAMAAHNQQ